MYNIAAITGGKTAPSAIYRFRSIIDALDEEGINLQEICPYFPKYPPKSTVVRPFWLAAALLERLTYIYKTSGYDAIILQRELISTLPTIEKLLPGNKILDVDDAIYLNKRGWAARNAAEASIGVVCGNQVLAEKFSQWNNNIEIIPTGVDIEKMQVQPNRLDIDQRRVIGWIGTPGNLGYVDEIADSLITVLTENKNTELRIVTSHKEAIPSSLQPYATFVQWYPGIEFQQLPSWSVGIMPLADDDWARGKCSFKLLQYLSAGIPAVASAVGMNIEVMNKGTAGYLARSNDEWTDGLLALLADDETNLKKGLNGRVIAEENYSLPVIASRWREVLDKWL